jgi:hypothetical protein
VASKKRTAEDGSPLDVNKRLKPAEPGVSPAPTPMQGMHGMLKPPESQQKSSRSSGTPPKAPPEVYHKLPGQFYRPSSADGNHEQQTEPSQQHRQVGLPHQVQHQPQQHNVQPSGTAPPIDPSLFSMYPEPVPNNAGSFSMPTNPYNMPEHSSANQSSLYALPSLEQIATEVLDMNGGGDENGDAGLAAIQAFNRQRDGFIHAYQQQNGGLMPMNVAPPVDGSVDSGVSMSGVTGEKDGSSPPGFNVFSINNGPEAVVHDATQENVPSLAVHHELPPVHDVALKPEEQQRHHEHVQFEAQPMGHDTVESPPFAEYQHIENGNRRESFGGIPFYQPPSSRSPEIMRSMPHGFPPSSPNKPKRGSFVATSPEMFRCNSREFSQPLEESDDVRMARMLQQDDTAMA